jgi:hypothetical protein
MLGKTPHPDSVGLLNMQGEFDKTMQSIAALAPLIGEAAQHGHAGYSLMKDKSNPELTDAQKIMMIIANSMPVVADGAQKGSDVYNIWKGKTAQPAMANLVPHT